MNFYIGLDSGGTFMKAALYDASGTQHATAKVSASVLNEQQGWVERDLDALWDDAVNVIQQLLMNASVDPKKIKGISISAQGKGVYLLDKQGANLGRGIMSSDSRSLPIVKKWLQQDIHKKIYPITLQTLWTGHPVSIIRWLKENQPETYANIGAIMMAHDYIRYRLTGVIAAEITNMSESNLFNATTGQYDRELLKIFDIEEVWSALPPIIQSCDYSGAISQKVAEETGLCTGTPVFAGLFDIVATAICSGINSAHPALNYVMGTWAVTSGIAKQVTQENHNFVYGHYAITGEYIVHEASPTSAGNYQWFEDYLGKNGKFDHNENEALVASIAPASSDIYFVPFLYGSNQGLGLKSGFYGLQAHHTKGHIIQAIWEGILFCHHIHLERMLQRFPQTNVLKVTGGTTACKTWMQMLADLTGMRVDIPQTDETGSLGSAIIAMVGTKEYASIEQCIATLGITSTQVQPNPDNFQIYQKKYHRYKKLVQLFKQFEEEIND